MDELTFWLWVLALLVVGIPAAVVALERSGKALNRAGYALRIGALLAAAFFFSALSLLLQVYAPALPADLAAVTLYLLAPLWAVQRLRDLGRGKAIAFLAAIPLVNVALAVVLPLLPTPQTGDAGAVWRRQA